MKRLFSAFLILLLYISTISGVQAESYLPPLSKPKNLEEVLYDANSQLGRVYFHDKNSNEKTFNMNLWSERDSLVYGTPWGDYNARVGEHRYLGETMDGEDFTNVYFPHDAWVGGYLEDRNWLPDPWNNQTIRNNYRIRENEFNNNFNNLPYIMRGLETFYGNDYKGTFTYWQNYVHILQPPTYWAWGMGRMWHQTAGGSIWYATVPIAPYRSLMVNFYAKDFDPGVPVEIIDGAPVYLAESGQTYIATVTFGADQHLFTSELPLYMIVAGMQKTDDEWVPKELAYQDGSGELFSMDGMPPVVPQGVKLYWARFAEESEVTVTFNWTAEPGTTRLAAVINHNYPADEPVEFVRQIMPYETNNQFADNVAEIPIVIRTSPDLYIREINPGTTETEGGKSYNALVTYGLKSDAEYTMTAKLGLTHNNYGINGINNETIELEPGEEKTFNFTFTGIKTAPSVLEAEIWPVAPTTNDRDWSNNSKQIVLPPKTANDLRATVIQNSSPLRQEDSKTITGTLFNDGDKVQTTSYVWRVNGSVVATQTITLQPKSAQNVSRVYTAPADATPGSQVTVELEINPNRNQPPDEPNWVNNRSRTTFSILYKNETPPDGGLSEIIIID